MTTAVVICSRATTLQLCRISGHLVFRGDTKLSVPPFASFSKHVLEQVQAEVASGTKADTADRLLYLWGQLDEAEIGRWNTGVLPAVAGRC